MIPIIPPVPTLPGVSPGVAATAATDETRAAVLQARYVVLERELETAPFHRVGTFWWDERTKEMRFIKQRLGT